jgi:hypothetical protein
MRLAFTDPEHFKHFTSLANAENVLSGSEQSRLGGSLGFMFYPDFQEVVCLSARVGKSVYALLGNTHFQILIRLQEGSETRRYGGQTDGDRGWAADPVLQPAPPTPICGDFFSSLLVVRSQRLVPKRWVSRPTQSTASGYNLTVPSGKFYPLALPPGNNKDQGNHRD